MAAEKNKRVIDHVDFRFTVYVLIIAVFVFYALSLTGCLSTSPGIPNIYLIKIFVPSSTVEARVGFFGICLQRPDSLDCASTHGQTAQSLARRFSGPSNATLAGKFDTEALMSTALTYQGKIFLSLLAASGVIFFFSTIAFLLFKRSLRMGGEAGTSNEAAARQLWKYRRTTLVLGEYFIALSLASAFATTQTAGALELTTTTAQSAGVIRISGGKTIQVLQWLIVGFSVLFHWLTRWTFEIRGGIVSAGNHGAAHQKPTGGALPPPPM